MTIQIIKNQIDRFLASEDAGVLAIKGDWGIGKTFTWNKYLVEAKNENRIGLSKYSYVPLFGVNSLDSFKYSIFENVVDRRLIGTDANVDTFKKNSASLSASLGRKGLKLGASLLKDFGPVIESISFLSLQKHLICIDDLERKGKDLSIKDVLGLISLLKEQKKCQVVLLLNDGEEGLEDYVKYREKAIDVELRFNPTAEECSAIAYENNDEYLCSTLSNFSEMLNIKNIRVLKKIERLVKLVLPLCKEFEQEIEYQVIQSITLFSWSFYSHSDEIPSLDFVLNRGYRNLGVGDDFEEEESPQEKKWNAIISDYRYTATDELDLVLSRGVKTGYIDDEEFIKRAQEKNAEVVASKSEGSFSSAWDLYHDSFDNNKDEVINTLYESFKVNAAYISPTNLNGTVTLFKELGENDKALEIIEIYASERKGTPELFNLEKVNFWGDIKDADVVSKFKAVYQQSVTTETAKEVLERISSSNGWRQSDEVVLSNTSIDEYYDLFKSERGEHLSSYVRACLRFGELSNRNENCQEIASRSKEALKRIALESDINRLRVKGFGVEP